MVKVSTKVFFYLRKYKKVCPFGLFIEGPTIKSGITYGLYSVIAYTLEVYRIIFVIASSRTVVNYDK